MTGIRFAKRNGTEPPTPTSSVQKTFTESILVKASLSDDHPQKSVNVYADDGVHVYTFPNRLVHSFLVSLDILLLKIGIQSMYKIFAITSS